MYTYDDYKLASPDETTFCPNCDFDEIVDQGLSDALQIQREEVTPRLATITNQLTALKRFVRDYGLSDDLDDTIEELMRITSDLAIDFDTEVRDELSHMCAHAFQENDACLCKQCQAEEAADDRDDY
jgi:hypothetical protein